jgi:hypothetical protein
LKYLELIATNGGCDLPCWWGIRPGETRWDDAYKLLGRLSPRISRSVSGAFSFYTVYLSVPRDVAPVTLNHFYEIELGIVSMVEAHVGMVEAYRVDDILRRYGPPSEVWIRTHDAPLDGRLPFQVVLYYAESQFVVGYDLNGVVQNKDEVSACFGPLEDVTVVAWEQGWAMTFPDVAAATIGFREESWSYLSLQEATGMAVDEIGERFLVLAPDSCLVTPGGLWPPQGGG